MTEMSIYFASQLQTSVVLRELYLLFRLIEGWVQKPLLHYLYPTD